MLRVSPVPCVELKLIVQEAPLFQLSVAGVAHEPGEHPDPEAVNGTPDGLLVICTERAVSDKVITQPSYKPLKPPEGSHDGEELLPARMIEDGVTASPVSDSVPVYPR